MVRAIGLSFTILMMNQFAYGEAQKTYSQIAEENAKKNTYSELDSGKKNSGVYSAGSIQRIDTSDSKKLKGNKDQMEQGDDSLSSYYRPRTDEPTNETTTPAVIKTGGLTQVDPSRLPASIK